MKKDNKKFYILYILSLFVIIWGCFATIYTLLSGFWCISRVNCSANNNPIYYINIFVSISIYILFILFESRHIKQSLLQVIFLTILLIVSLCSSFISILSF